MAKKFFFLQMNDSQLKKEAAYMQPEIDEWTQ